MIFVTVFRRVPKPVIGNVGSARWPKDMAVSTRRV